MEKKMIGKSGLEASALSLGCWAIGGGEWWGNNDDQISIDTICRAVQLGVNWIDTARVYGFGHSEEVVGKALKLLPRRKMILSTKCGIQWYDDGGELHFMKEGHAVRRDLAPKAIRRDLELSLKTMGTEYVDVYYTHWQCKTYGLVPIEETMEELLKMKQEGKIRAIGASNTDLQILEDYIRAGQLDVIQEKLSILDRKSEELLPFCEEHGIMLQTYSPIEQGLLAGKASDNYVPKPGEVRDGKTWWRPENIRRVNGMLVLRADGQWLYYGVEEENFFLIQWYPDKASAEAKLAELEALGDGKQYLVDLSLTRENPSAAENFGSSNPVQLRS